MTNIRAIIAEDEMLARESLQAMAQSNGIQVVAACGNGKGPSTPSCNIAPTSCS